MGGRAVLKLVRLSACHLNRTLPPTACTLLTAIHTLPPHCLHLLTRQPDTPTPLRAHLRPTACTLPPFTLTLPPHSLHTPIGNPHPPALHPHTSHPTACTLPPHLEDRPGMWAAAVPAGECLACSRPQSRPPAQSSPATAPCSPYKQQEELERKGRVEKAWQQEGCRCFTRWAGSVGGSGGCERPAPRLRPTFRRWHACSPCCHAALGSGLAACAGATRALLTNAIDIS